MNDLALADELRGELRRSAALAGRAAQDERVAAVLDDRVRDRPAIGARHLADRLEPENAASAELAQPRQGVLEADRKSTRLNSSHSQISYAVFCLKKKKNKNRAL